MKDNLGFYDVEDTRKAATERRIDILQERIKQDISELQDLHEQSYWDLVDDLDLQKKTTVQELKKKIVKTFDEMGIGKDN